MIAIIVIVGIIIGLISSIFGVGGGFITVPALLMIFTDLPHQYAVATSLGVIFVNALINSFRFYRQKRIPNFKIITTMIAGILIGAYLGTSLSEYISNNTFKNLFITVLILSIINTFFKNGETNKDFKLELSKLKLFISFVFAIIAGIISSMTGLGGGIVLIPIFLIILKLPFRLMPVYSNSIIVFGTFGGTLTHMITGGTNYAFQVDIFNKVQFGNVNLGIILVLLAGSFFSTKWGINLGPKIPHKITKWLFLTLLTLVALKMALIN